MLAADYNNRLPQLLRARAHIILSTPISSEVHVHRKWLILLLALFFSYGLQGFPSQQQPPSPPPIGVPQPEESGPNMPSRIQKEMEKKANEQRQADLKRDAEKLLKLSTELKEYVDKSNQNLLSLDVIKKAEEIEKLAHSVKTKMKGNN
jgi:hypothetical protein